MSPSAAGDLFQAPGSTWTRVQPRLALMRRIGVLIRLALWLLALVVVRVILPEQTTWILLAGGVLVVIAVVRIVVIGRWVANVGYAEREEDLWVTTGALLRRLTVVPYGRMQLVDVHQGPLERMFGLASVQLHTAAAGTDASIPGLAPDEAARLRDRLTELGSAELSGL